ncbi:hypothetical protein [Actinomadura parmotrematis]|uniref:2'-5' RNA ligase family protein n=1 Tax=Actinomadura parmotrematis TaxID=2864039 RepID=A0ABS7FYL0_9ACTN|nr:hypothetical protein [Actinomadura parmotrematis]MBW8485533.1 hypothetical protein [Actinomadura parmotrematis]
MSRPRVLGVSALLGGWLFADLLLGLTIVMLGAQAPPDDDPAAGAAPSPSPCATRLGGVKAKPAKLTFTVSAGASADRLAAQVAKAMRPHAATVRGRHAGMVLTFGAAGGAGPGERLAARVNKALAKTDPATFRTAAFRNFHDLSSPDGTVSLEIYFVSDGCPTSPRAQGTR